MWFWVLAVITITLGFVVFFGAPYVPTKRREIRVAFRKLYLVSSHDVVVDLGSGDGVVLREAARCGAKAIGYELNPIFVFISRWLSRRSGRVEIHTGNMWRVRLPENTTVVYAFVVTRDAGKLLWKMQQEANRLRRPLKLICYGIQLPNKVPVKKIGAHFLYDFIPLQPPKT